MYSKKVMEHFRNPRNVGEIKNPSGHGKVGNIVCGDIMECFIKVGKNKKGKEIIKDIKVKTMGCVAALATSSITTELVKGKTLKEAINMKKNTVTKSLGNLPKTKIHCSVLATNALKEAIYDYLKKNGKPIPKKLGKNHKRIEKEMATIKEKYKDFVNFEEEVMKE